jgi:hypothetical protein
LLGGIGELGLIAFAPMAYGPGPARTDWIEGTALWVGSLSILGSLVAIGFGVFLVSRSSSRPKPRYHLARAFVLVGAAVGTTAYHLVLLAISYDLRVGSRSEAHPDHPICSNNNCPVCQGVGWSASG